MGTRGFVTFAVDGQEKTAYNHFDSYPSALGLKVLGWLRDVATSTAQPPCCAKFSPVTGCADHKRQTMAGVRAQAAALRVIKRGEVPSPDDIARLAPWTDLSVSERSTQDWYCLLRGTQGDPAAMLAAGVIEDSSGFPADSLYAECGYVVDLDGDGRFEVYEGFQSSPHRKGRFARMKGENGYYPVALKASWPLGALPSDREFMAATDPEDES